MDQSVQRRPMMARLPGPQFVGGQFVQWGQPIQREDRKMLRAGLTAASVGVGLLGAFASVVTFIPGIAGLTATPFMAAAHLFDRAKHAVVANDETEFRAKFYSQQIFRTLGITPRPGQLATPGMFKQAAAINPELAKLYHAPLHHKDKENRTSMLTNGGIIAASALTGAGGALVGVGEAAKHTIEGIKIFGEAGKAASVAKGAITTAAVVARDGVGAIAGGALASALSKDEMDPHALVEALDKSVTEAQMQGIDVAEVATPNLIFALRVAQDENFANELKKQFGKPFHKLDAQIQGQVMEAYPALANAATSEASAVKQGILPVKELAASKPNLNANAQRYAVGTGANSSFTAMVQSRREAANDPRIADSNVRSHVARLNAQRAAAPTVVGRKA